MNHSKAVFWLYTLLKSMALLTLALLMLKTTSLRTRFLETGTFVGLLLLVVLIPVGALVIWGMNRQRRAQRSRAQVVYHPAVSNPFVNQL